MLTAFEECIRIHQKEFLEFLDDREFLESFKDPSITDVRDKSFKVTEYTKWALQNQEKMENLLTLRLKRQYVKDAQFATKVQIYKRALENLKQLGELQSCFLNELGDSAFSSKHITIAISGFTSQEDSSEKSWGDLCKALQA